MNNLQQSLPSGRDDVMTTDRTEKEVVPSDDEVIFVEERRAVAVRPVSVKSEPGPSESLNTPLLQKTGTGYELSSSFVEQESTTGRPKFGLNVSKVAVDKDTGHLERPVADPSEPMDELSAAVHEVLRSNESSPGRKRATEATKHQSGEREGTVQAPDSPSLGREGTKRATDDVCTAVVEPQERAPYMKNMFTAQFVGLPKFLDTSKLSRKHIWNTEELRQLPFHYWVSNNPNRRTDMQFFHELQEYHPTLAKNTWAQLRENVRYVIPETLRCSRSFVREMLEVYYLDRTDAFLDTVDVEDISVQNLPLLEERITDRQWNVFSRRPGHFRELFNRIEHKLWLPHDQPEIETYAVEDLRNDYPAVKQWFLDLDQPSGLPIPCPPIVYYYHEELAHVPHTTVCTNRMRKLECILRLEYACLFLCTWFMECALGSRHFVVRSSTVDEIAQCLEGRVSIIRDVSTSYILQLMRQGGTFDAQMYNTFRYVKTKDEYYNMYREHTPPLPDCNFLTCYKGTGIINTRARGGEVAYQTLWCRRMNMALKNSLKSEREWISPLDAILRAEDLDRLPELRALIRARGWDQNSELCVSDILRKLLEINSKSVQTNIRITSGSSTLREERDSLVRILNNAIDGPSQGTEHHMYPSERGGGWESVRYYDSGGYGGSSNRKYWNEPRSGYVWENNGNDYGNDRSGRNVNRSNSAWSTHMEGREPPSSVGSKDGRIDYGRENLSGKGSKRREADYTMQQAVQKRPKLAGSDGYCAGPSEYCRIELPKKPVAPRETEIIKPGESAVAQSHVGRDSCKAADDVQSTINEIVPDNNGKVSSGMESPAVRGAIGWPAFQIRKSQRNSAGTGHQSYPATPLLGNAFTEPSRTGTPTPEVDISRDNAGNDGSGAGLSAARQHVLRHPWGFIVQ